MLKVKLSVNKLCFVWIIFSRTKRGLEKYELHLNGVATIISYKRVFNARYSIRRIDRIKCRDSHALVLASNEAYEIGKEGLMLNNMLVKYSYFAYCLTGRIDTKTR